VTINSGISKLITVSEYRDRLFSDISFWLILIGFSYFMLLLIHRNLFVKKKSFKILLFIAIILSILANLIHYNSNTPNTLMILNAPLICVIIYRLSYEVYLKIFNKPPMSPFDLTFNFNDNLTKDRIFNIVILLTIGLSSGFLLAK
jgi:hypothetical protein